MKYPKWVLVISLGLIACSILLCLSIGSYSLPIFDDYCRGSANPTGAVAPNTPHTGYFAAPSWAYLNWQGRWLAILVEILVLHPIDMVGWYPVLLLVLVAGYIWLSSFFFRTLFGPAGWQATAVFWLLYWSSVPSPSSAFFNVTFSVENLGGCALALAAWALMEAKAPPGRALPVLRYGALMACVAGVSALHELTGVVFCLALAFRVAIGWAKGDEQRRLLAAVFLIAGISLLITVAAPGNRVRSTLFAPRRTVALTVNALAVQSTSSLISWLFSDLRLWFATVWLTCTVMLAPRSAADGRDRKLITIAFFSVLAVSYAVPIVALGEQMPNRTLGQVYFILLVGWFVLVMAYAPNLARRWRPDPKVLQGIGAAALLMFSGAVAFDGNARQALRDLRSREARQWHAQHLDRIKRLRAVAAAHEWTAELPAITARAFILPHPTDSPNPDYTSNRCMEWYFGVKRVSVKAD